MPGRDYLLYRIAYVHFGRGEGNKTIEKTAVWRETRLILSESHMFQGFRVCRQRKTKKLQT